MSNPMTFSTLFSGFGGKCHGFKAAGLVPINHFEIDPRIAEVGQANSTGKYIVGNVCDQNWNDFEAPDVMGASPVCKNASVANAGATESDIDIQTAQATARAIRVWQPKIFFLENVWGYRDFAAFKLIERTLIEEGYSTAYWHLNAADYGVPQTRKRLILVAIKEKGHGGARLRLQRPEPTHDEHPEPLIETLFGLNTPLQKWVGWYEAIEDLVPDLPTSQFAEWQMKRLGKISGLETLLVGDQKTTGLNSVVCASCEKPAMTIRAAENGGAIPRAFIADSQNCQKSVMTCDMESPAFTVTDHQRPSHLPKAFLVDCTHCSDADLTTRDSLEPSHTICASHFRRLSNEPRAFIVEGSAAGEDNPFTMPIRMEDEPVFTQRARQNNPRAFIVDGQQTTPSKSGLREDRGLITRDGEEPLFTVASSCWKGMPTAGLQTGRVVSMTPRALARFQSFPDSFILSGHRKTDCTGIGNAVPPLLAQRVIESILKAHF